MTSNNNLTSKIIPLPLDNIDTDQIIPARFLKAMIRKVLLMGFLQIGGIRVTESQYLSLCSINLLIRVQTSYW